MMFWTFFITLRECYMLWTLVRKELLTNLLTLRLSVAFVCTIALVVLMSFIGNLDYSRRTDIYENERKETQEALGKARIYDGLRPSIHLPPQPLSVFCLGIESWVGTSVTITLDYIPESPNGWGVISSDFMKTLVQVDFTTVVALVLSFLAVALGFDGICGERERGTLRQLLVNPVPRGYVVVAKLIGGWLSLWLPLAVAFVLALLIALGNADLTFSGDDWLRLALFFVLSCLFLAQVFSLSLMVSAFVRQGATSLIICLFGWLVAGVVYMNVLPSMAEYGLEESTWQLYVDGQNSYFDEFGREMDQWEEKNPGPGEAYTRGLETDGVLRFAHPQGYAWMQEGNAYRMDKYLETVDRSSKLRWDAQWDRAEQALLVDNWAFLSPLTNYQVLSYQLARTTLDDKFVLVYAARRYRETYIQYLRGKNAFGHRRWFTDDPEDQQPMIAAPQEVTSEMLAADSPFMQERLQWAQRQNEEAQADDGRSLDLTGLPKFAESGRRNLAQSLEVMLAGLVVLFLSLGASAMVAIYRFLHYDPR